MQKTRLNKMIPANVLAFLAPIAILPTFLLCDRVSAVEIPRDFQQMIVSIDRPASPAEQIANPLLGPYRQVGTGFFASLDVNDPLQRVVLITAKHVLEEACQSSTRVYLRHINSFKDPSGNVLRWELQICERSLMQDQKGNAVMAPDGSPLINIKKLWVPHPTADIAAIKLPEKSQNTPPDMKAFRFSDILNDEIQKNWDIGPSDETFILAFHPGVVSGEPSSLVIRHGTISLFAPGADTFLVDSFVFPGNSGSPVILKPTVVNLKGYQFSILGNPRPAYLLGVVVEFISYTDMAISLQTQRPRISFEENSGLVKAVRAEKIAELLRIVFPEGQHSTEQH